MIKVNGGTEFESSCNTLSCITYTLDKRTEGNETGC